MWISEWVIFSFSKCFAWWCIVGCILELKPCQYCEIFMLSASNHFSLKEWTSQQKQKCHRNRALYMNLTVNAYHKIYIGQILTRWRHYRVDMMDTTIVVGATMLLMWLCVDDLYVQGFHESFSHPLWHSFSPMFTVYTCILTLGIKKM